MMNIENETGTENSNTESTSTDVGEAPTEGKQTKKEKAPPAFLAFVEGLKAHAESLGLQFKDQAGYAQWFNGETGHKLYVAKQGKEVKRVDTTLELIGVLDGAYELEQPNGRIACHVPATIESVTAALTMLADASVGKIRPPHRAKKADGVTEAVSDAPAAE